MAGLSNAGSQNQQETKSTRHEFGGFGFSEMPRAKGDGRIGLDADWHRLTNAGNRALAAGDIATASQLYREALTEADRLFDLACDGGGLSVLLAPMVHTIACQNAAEAMKQAGVAADARRLNVHALERLIAVAESATSPLALRVNCVRHMKYALAFLDEHAADPECRGSDLKDLVAEARDLAAEVFRIAGHLIQSGPDGGGSAADSGETVRRRLS